MPNKIYTLKDFYLKCISLNIEQCDIYFLIKNFYNINSYEVILNFNKQIDKQLCDNIFCQVTSGIPIPYICGRVLFNNLTILLNRHCLIPRVETEELVEIIKQDNTNKQNKKLNILDMCSGSGCIGLSLANYFNKSNVALVDLQPQCLKISKDSATLNNIKNVEFINSDLFFGVKKKEYDIIVSNPPYIPSNIVEENHEPRIALDGGADGLDIYKGIFSQLEKYTKKGSKCYFELYAFNTKQLLELIKSLNIPFSREIINDMSKKPRFLKLIRL